MLGVDKFIINANVEHTASILDEFRLQSQSTLNRFRQTGGFREIVSHAAIRDGYFHS